MALGNKEVMAKNIRRYMEKKNVNSSIICADLGFPMPTFSDWINAKTYPRIDKIEMMANYFGVKKSALVEDWDEVEWNPQSQEITETENYYEDNEAASLAQFLKDHPGHKVLFDASRKVKAEDLEKALRAIGLFIDEE